MVRRIHAAIALLSALLLTNAVVGSPKTVRPQAGASGRLAYVQQEARRLIEDAASTYAVPADAREGVDPADEAELLLARVARYAHPKNEAETYVLAAQAARTARLFRDADHTVVAHTAALLLENDALAHELVFTWWEGHDQPDRVLSVLGRLARTHGAERVADAPVLVAALCVVHDEQEHFRLNENIVPPDSPERLFGYFTAADLNSIAAKLSPELLVWVVDGVNADELVWANQRHAGHANVGRLFHSIAYDHDHVRTGSKKRVTVEGLTLPNIKTYGGVCIDQAHYACMSGRAIGVPTALAVGRGSSVGHAWVGYLRVERGRAFWDFDEGCYEEYRQVRGNVRDPQRRAWVPDGEAVVRAASYGLSAERRHHALALVEASRVMGAHNGAWSDDVVPFFDNDREVHAPDLESRLALLEQGATINPGALRAWEEVHRLAQGEAMTDAMKDRWATAALRLVGQRFLGFAVDFIMPLAATVEDIDERSRVLGSLHRTCRSKPGIAAEVMLANARLYEQAGENERAYRSYAFAAEEYANVSSHAVGALERATSMLIAHGHHGEAVELAESAWARTRRPGYTLQFARSSNWYRMGRIYASTLRLAGMDDEASSVTRRLGGSGQARP